MQPYALYADLILIAHASFIAFVVLGQVLILAGRVAQWGWVRNFWFRAAHIKTEACYRVRLLLTQRRNLKRKFLDLENTIRHSLKAFGVKLGAVDAESSMPPCARP